MNVRWSVVLPVGHLIVDCVLLALWIGAAQARVKPAIPKSVIVKPVLLQESGAPGWDFRFDPPPQFLLLPTGDMPAFAIAEFFRPQRRLSLKKPWDLVWFSIYEAASLVVWFAMGLSLDRGWLPIVRTMAGFLVVRIIFTASFGSGLVAELGYKVQTFFWLWVVAYVIFCGLRWVIRRSRPPALAKPRPTGTI